MRNQCQITGCSRQAAARGRCTTHLGLSSDTLPASQRAAAKKPETPMPRKFQIVDQLPGRTLAPQGLTGDLKALQDTLVANPCRYVRVPHDLMHKNFERLDHLDKKRMMVNFGAQMRKARVWQLPGGRINTAMRVGEDYGLYAWWEPDKG